MTGKYCVDWGWRKGFRESLLPVYQFCNHTIFTLFLASNFVVKDKPGGLDSRASVVVLPLNFIFSEVFYFHSPTSCSFVGHQLMFSADGGGGSGVR